MPIRGIDASGPAFFEMVGDWAKQGNEYYLPLPDTATSEEDFEADDRIAAAPRCSSFSACWP